MNHKLQRLTVPVVFFFSGMAGLVYQIIWMRLIYPFFGITTHTVIVITSAFMTGLGLGSIIATKIVRKGQNNLLIYGVLELIIGITAVFMPHIFKLIEQIYLNSSLINLTGSWLLVFKFIVVFTAILIPTTAMGITLPVLVEFSKNSGGTLSKRLSRLYSINTFGAMTGALVTGFFLIELFGLGGTNRLAAAISITLGICALLISKSVKTNFKKTDMVKYEVLHANLLLTPNQRNFLITAFAFSGTISMAYETTWVRLLTPYTGTYVYAFSIILTVILFGIAFGSMLYKSLSKYFNYPTISFSLLEYLIGISTFASLAIMSLPVVVPVELRLFFVLVPPSILMGLIFPIISSVSINSGVSNTNMRSIARTNRKVYFWEKSEGSFIGFIYGANTLGCTLGPLLTGFLLLPIFGTVRTILILSTTNIIIALAALLVSDLGKIRKIFFTSLYLFSSLSLLWILTYRHWSLLQGNYKLILNKFVKEDYKYSYLEDETASVIAGKSPDGRSYHLLVDGIGMSIYSDVTKLMAHLPITIHPKPKEFLIICFGIGTTYRSALTYDIDVDAVELVPSVVSMFPIFFNDTDRILSNPRGRIIINDGRNYLKTTGRRYDIVQIDPPPPVNSAGTTILYSKDFYKDAKSVLKEGGFVFSWIYKGTTAEDLKILIKTFSDSFTYAYIFKSPKNDGYYLLGSVNPVEINSDKIHGVLDQNPDAKRDLNENNFWDSERILSLYMGDNGFIDTLTGNAKTVTDDQPITEYFLIRNLLKNLRQSGSGAVDEFDL